jgi:DNA-binding PadR family transcriptional regulator
MELEILDALLTYLKKTNSNTFQFIKRDIKNKSELLKGIDEKTLTSALSKLYKDDFINKDLQEIGTLKGHLYEITFEGLSFISEGGYVLRKERNQLQDKKLNDIAIVQAFQQKWIHVLTWVIGVGTLVSAIYYFLEILKIFGLLNSCPCGN